MANAYLEIAERVIRDRGCPLSAKEICQIAISEGLMPKHLYGATPHKTFQARLSVDIVQKPDTTIFCRTGAGIFFLKSLQANSGDKRLKPYVAVRRVKELRREAVLAIPTSVLDFYNITDGLDINLLRFFLSEGCYSYKKWRDIKKDSQYVPVHSFVMVRSQGKLLSYHYGRYSTSDGVAKAKKSVGFGRLVTESDNDLLYDSLSGIVENAILELIYAVGLPSDLAEKARYEDQIKPIFGARLRDKKTGVEQLFVILNFICPKGFVPLTQGSANNLSWISPQSLPNDLSDFDEISRELLLKPSSDVRSPLHAKIECQAI